MSHSTDTLLFNQTNRFIASMQQIMRGMGKVSAHLHPQSLSELLLQLESVTTPALLTKTVNRIQYQLWELPEKEQALYRKRLITILSIHVLQGTNGSLRLEAAGWLRLLLQAGLVTKPEEIFVTLVTATVHPRLEDIKTSAVREQKALLHLIFQCFWPFRFPYPAYSWEAFPATEVFYPLAPLLELTDNDIQDALIGIFAELPTVDDAAILEHLLPVALHWSQHADAERRRRVASILARVNLGSAQEALVCLQIDTDPLVRESAKNATAYARRA
jgi:hypothetical protein